MLQAHLCTVWQNGQYKATRDIGAVRASFADMLRRLETDYIDVGMIHYVDTMDTWYTVANGEVMRYALEPVSYTHLDVYKRQAFTASVWPARRYSSASAAVLRLIRPAALISVAGFILPSAEATETERHLPVLRVDVTL